MSSAVRTPLLLASILVLGLGAGCAGAAKPALEQPVGSTHATPREAPEPPAPSVIERREALRDGRAAQLEKLKKRRARRILQERDELGNVEEIDGPRELEPIRQRRRRSNRSELGRRLSDGPRRGGEPTADVLYHQCRLPSTPRQAPQFPFDSAALRPRGQRILDQVANCMNQGELLGARIIVLGYADPVGSKTYNLKLAMDRARTARLYLIQRGIDPSRITIASRGEHYARGASPEGRRLDRRVELQLAPSSP